MQRYFVSSSETGKIKIDDQDIFHMSHVMRYKKDDQFEINDDGKIYLAKIVSFDPFEFEIINEILENHELDGFIRLLYCLPKGDKLELVIQKAVELGVDEVVLINSSRSIKRIDENSKEKKLIRFNRIIKEASEQSKREKKMKLDDVIEFDKISNYPSDISLIAYENTACTLNDLKEILKEVKGKTINILVGAEGGFSKDEVEKAKFCGFKEISLGKRILRSETAAIYIMSLLSCFMDE